MKPCDLRLHDLLKDWGGLRDYKFSGDRLPFRFLLKNVYWTPEGGKEARDRLYHRYNDYNHSTEVGFRHRARHPGTKLYLPGPQEVLGAHAWDSKAREMIRESMAAWTCLEDWKGYWWQFDVYQRTICSYSSEIAAREFDPKCSWYRPKRCRWRSALF